MDATWPQPIEARFHPNRKSQRIDVARYTRHTTKQPVRSGGGLATAGVPAKIVLTPEAYVSFRRNFSRFSMSSAVGILPQPEASPRRHGVQAKQKMETLLPGLGITCEEMGAMTSNMSCRRAKVPRCSENRCGHTALLPGLLFEALCTAAPLGVSFVGRDGCGRINSGPGTAAITLARPMSLLPVRRPRIPWIPVRGGVARALYSAGNFCVEV